jgi:hypothetical protein
MLSVSDFPKRLGRIRADPAGRSHILAAGRWLAQAAGSSAGHRARLIALIDRFTINIQIVEDRTDAGNPAKLRELWRSTAAEFPRGDDLFV